MFTILGTDGKEYGPVSTAKIREWMLAGRANLETKIRRAGDTEWHTLGEFPELTGSASVAPGTPVAAPATFVAPEPASFTSGLPLASRWLRLGAAIIDSLIGGIFLGPGFAVLMAAGAFTDTNESNLNTPLLLAGFGLLGFAALILIGIQIYLLVTHGQTIGKKILGIKIVTFDTEENPGFVKVFLLRIVVNGIICFVPLYRLVDLLFIFRADHRCVHDLLAGTKVVKA